ncbi:hypothetical protein H101_00631 [Trichophyton interdigitale H6]|nr:hypothetical protein H101_00631 [Trichophyton interdigitale H6]
MQLHLFITLLLASSAIAGVVDTFSAPQLAESLGIRDLQTRQKVNQIDTSPEDATRVVDASTGMNAARAVGASATAIDADRKDRNLSRLARLVTGLYAGRLDLGNCFYCCHRHYWIYFGSTRSIETTKIPQLKTASPSYNNLDITCIFSIPLSPEYQGPAPSQRPGTA